MAAIQHLPFGFTKALGSPPPSSSSSCQSMGRTLFHPALDSHSLDHAQINLSAPHSLPSSKQAQFVLQQLRDMVAACKAFTHELTEVCNSGVRVSQCMASSFKEVMQFSESSQMFRRGCMPQDIVRQFSDTWNQLAAVTQNVIESLDQMPFSVVQDSLAKLELHLQNSSLNETASSDESNQILLASFIAVLHLQYQFSLSVCESLVDLMKMDFGELGLNNDVGNSACENGMKSSLDINVNKETINSIQKHFSAFMNILQAKRCEETSGNSTNAKQVNGTRSDSSNARSHAYRVWPRSSSLDSGTANIENKSKTWSSKGLPSSQGLTSDPLMGHTSELWQQNSSLESLWSFSAHSCDVANSAKSKSTGLASNNELQAVVSLLSYQTNDQAQPPASSSHPAVSSSVASVGDITSCMWAPEEKTVTMTKQHPIFKKSESVAHELKPSGTWPRSGSNLTSCIWGIYSDAQETALPRKVDVHFERSAVLPHAVMPVQQDPSNFSQYPRGLSLISDDHRYSHLRATKSTSWPVVDHPLDSHPSDSNSSSDHDEGNSGHVGETNSAFFMGLDLVGNDLMASVRQRRHSSGSMFVDVSGNANCSSIRTKSIDSITMEEKSRLSLWPNNVASASQNEKIDECVVAVGFGNALWSSEHPQGLPPSGADSRSKPKVERKYSLFGHAAC